MSSISRFPRTLPAEPRSSRKVKGFVPSPKLAPNSSLEMNDTVHDSLLGSDCPGDVLIIWDWDDTVLCSHFCNRHGITIETHPMLSRTKAKTNYAGQSLPENWLGKIKATAESSLQTLALVEKAISGKTGTIKYNFEKDGYPPPLDRTESSSTTDTPKHGRASAVIESVKGRMIFVTNAEDGWIELACSTFVPTLTNVMSKMEIISARTKYENMGFASGGVHNYCAPSMWKERAFKAEIEKFLGDRIAYEKRTGVHLAKTAHIISIGDSIHERNAIMSICGSINKKAGSSPLVFCKSVKFLERPSTEQLLRQHELLRNALPELLCRPTDMDLVIRVDDHPQQQQSTLNSTPPRALDAGTAASQSQMAAHKAMRARRTGV